MKRYIFICIVWWFATTTFVAANPERKTIHAGEFVREYLIYTPKHSQHEKAGGIIICLHGFGRTMYDFVDEYDLSGVADSLNMIIVAPQALPEQDPNLLLNAAIINLLNDNNMSLNSVWGCGLSIHVSTFGVNMFNAELNKDVDDVDFIDRLIDGILSEYQLPDENIFMLGTSLGGFMTYQYALKKGNRLSGIISIAGSMGLSVKGMDSGIQVPVCDFHSITDEVVPYSGSLVQFLSLISLAMPKADVIDYWTKTNSTGKPVAEQIHYYPSTNGITVEKITYPDADNEVIHYKINGASHSYFFKEEEGDCMDHVEEITRFIQSHTSGRLNHNLNMTSQKLLFYPNPVQDKIYFDAESGKITLYDIAGQQLFTQSFINGQADLSFLKQGIYFIQVQSGNTVQVNKLIKK